MSPSVAVHVVAASVTLVAHFLTRAPFKGSLHSGQSRNTLSHAAVTRIHPATLIEARDQNGSDVKLIRTTQCAVHPPKLDPSSGTNY